MIAEKETCTGCGAPLRETLPGLETVCPACVVRAAQTPTTIKDGSEGTTWAQVFPQLEIESCLRDDPEAPVYLARVLGDGASERAILQLASGSVLTRAGGTAALLARAQRLAGTDLEGVAEVLDFGDLADAFFLVTTAPDWPTVPEAVSRRETEEVAALLAVITAEAENSLTVARAAGFGLRFDPETSFVNEERGEVMMTPPLIGAGEAALPEEARGLVELAEGIRIGSYELEAKVGEGGFGEVWRARQERPVKREVAIKILKEGLHSQRARARFQVEQQALARLDHPNVARFFEGGTTSDGRPYFAMEWIAGTSLTRYCDEREVSLGERLLLFRALGEAVQFAHQKGIIHRDIKSSNVMVAREGGEPSVKVIDFGIARAIEDPLTDGTLLTRAEEVVGTPASMSPEQAAGAGGSDLDARTDVYGLGVLLYELVGGRLPFDPTLPPDELRRRIREEDPPRPSSHVEDPNRRRQVRGDLDWITMRCLEKNPERRYRSVNALLRDLERHENNEPIEAGPPELSYRMGKFVRRNRLLVASAAMLVLILTAASLISWDSASRARAAEEESDRSLQDLQVAYKDVDSARSNSRQLLVNTLLEKGTGQFNEGDVVGLITLQEAVMAAEGDKLLQEKALELWTLAHAWLPGSVEEVFDDPYAVAISPNGKWAALCEAEGLSLIQVGSENKIPIKTNPRLLSLSSDDSGNEFDRLGLVISDDSKYLALFNPEAGAAQVWNIPSGGAATPMLEHPDSGSAVDLNMVVGWDKIAIDPTGGFLATFSAKGSLCLWDVSTGNLVIPPQTFKGLSEFHKVRFSPSGRCLAISVGKKVYFVDMQNRTAEPSVVEMSESVYHVEFIDETRVVCSHFNGASLWDVESGERVAGWSPLWSRRFHMIGDICRSPDGGSIAVASRNGEVVVLGTEDLEPQPRVFLHQGGGARSVGYHSRGDSIASGGIDGSVRFWSTENNISLGSWPQPGVIDQIVTSVGAGDQLLSKSRTRSVTPAQRRAVLRKFPDEPSTAFAKLPDGSVLMDVSDDGNMFLLGCNANSSLDVIDQSGHLIVAGLTATEDGETIVSAIFSPTATELIYSTISTEWIRFRMWSLETKSHTNFEYEKKINPQFTAESQANFLGEVLQAHPPLLITIPNSWTFDLLNLENSSHFRTVRLGSAPACAIVVHNSGWYGIGDQSGELRRFRIEDHEQLLPSLGTGVPLASAACAAGSPWLLTVERNELGDQFIKAWLLDDQAPSQFLSLPINHKGGSLHAVDERSFLYQHGSELRRLDLPEVTLRPGQIPAATAVALGHRKDEHGELRILTSEEFRAARAIARVRK